MRPNMKNENQLTAGIVAEIARVRAALPTPSMPASLQLATRNYDKLTLDLEKAGAESARAGDEAHLAGAQRSTAAMDSAAAVWENLKAQRAEAKRAVVAEMENYKPEFLKQLAPFTDEALALVHVALDILEESASILASAAGPAAKVGMPVTPAIATSATIVSTVRDFRRALGGRPVE